MVYIKLSYVNHPDDVSPKETFDIKWKEFFIVLPFKLSHIISRISVGGIESDYSYTLRHWWFWGSRTHTKTLSIDDDTECKIEVGYRD
jgi:hypothetical protein